MSTTVDKLFGIFENGVLTAILSGDSTPYKKKAVVRDLPDDFNGWVGVHSKELDEHMYVKSVERLVSEGLITLDEFHRVVDGKIINKTEIELIKEGIRSVPPGFRLENDVLIEMTEKEKLLSGVIAVPRGMCIDEETSELRPMNANERIAAGIDPLLDGWTIDKETLELRLMTELELYKENPATLRPGRIYDNGIIRDMTNAELYKDFYSKDPVTCTKTLRRLADDKFFARIEEGVEVEGVRFQANENSIKSATTALVGIQNGMVALPIYWRASGNNNIAIHTEEQFKVLLGAMMDCYNQQLTHLWEVKDALAASLETDFDSTYSILDAYLEE